jgi:signal peptidase II
LKRSVWGAVILPVIAALVVVSDQLTKYLVRALLPPGASWEIAQWLRSIVQITHVTNTGVAFGLFPRLGGVSALISAVISVVILIYQRQIPRGQWAIRLALGMMLGGAVGNLIDRIIRGTVVDFIDLNFWPLQSFPVWNIADSCVTVGTILLLLLMLWEDRKAATRETVSEETAAGST